MLKTPDWTPTPDETDENICDRVTMTIETRTLRHGWDEAVNCARLLGKDPISVSVFHPNQFGGGGYNIHFGVAQQVVVEAWQKSGEASDEVHAHLTEKIRTMENENKEFKDIIQKLEDQLEFFEVKFEEVTKEKDEIQDELEGVLKTTKGMENHYLLQHNTLNLKAENAEKEITQLKEKITILNGEILTSQDDNSQHEENYETQRKEQERLLQSANGKLKTSNEKLKSMSLELINAKNLILINDAASKELKKESDGKISSMEIALSEAKLNKQISNNASALKLNEAENSKTTQTEPISANEEETISAVKLCSWEEFDIIASRLREMYPPEDDHFLCGVYVEEFDKDEFNIYIRKK